MRFEMIFFLGVFFIGIKGMLLYFFRSILLLNNSILAQSISLPSNYSCNQNDEHIGFQLSASPHSARQLSPNCSLQQCYLSSNNNNSCFLSSTPCYEYYTINNSRYCAPGILCSILEPCNNITYTCTSNTSVCVVNSCCSTQAVCLPLSVTNFCILGIDILCTIQTDFVSFIHVQ
jgi:hypothetical protein